jgi:hypothetical protein
VEKTIGNDTNTKILNILGFCMNWTAKYMFKRNKIENIRYFHISGLYPSILASYTVLTTIEFLF